jgi:plastocyanin
MIMARIAEADEIASRCSDESPRPVLDLNALLVALTASLVLLSGLEPVAAGEVSGRIKVPEMPAAASMGNPGSFPGADVLSGAANPGGLAAIGPVLVYVAEAEAELPERVTADTRVRIVGGKMMPSLVAVSLGSRIEFQNADRRAHRVRSRTGPLRFDLGWQAPGMSRLLEVTQTGIIPVECMISRRVKCEIVVLAHSAFAIADVSGGYRLPELPPGHATIVAYAPSLGEVSREVTVPESGKVEVDFAF